MREEKFKYQYTYHILPYKYEGRYDEYITKLLKDRNMIEYRYDKVRNLELFSYFKKDILDLMFYEFPYKDSEDLNIQEKVRRLVKEESITFEYDIIDKEKNKMKMGDIFKIPVDDRNNNDSGKEKTSIKFDIEDFKIIVFKSGIAFIILKTVLINTRYISDEMDFNYRFKSILSKRDIIKKLDNIEICLLGDEVNGFEKLKQIILNYVGKNKNNKILENNEEKRQKEMREKYSNDKIFNNRNIKKEEKEEENIDQIEVKNEVLLDSNIVEYKQSFFSKIVDKIKKWFNIFK